MSYVHSADRSNHTLPLITLITVVYNNVNHIKGAIQSVLSQNHPHIEYVVIDGDSDDGTVEVIKEFQDKITVLLSEPDKGIYDALNKGIRHSSGDVVGFLHSDDFFSHDEIVSQIAKVFANDRVDVVYGDLNYVKKGQTNTIVRHWKAGEFSQRKLTYGWMPPHPAFYMRRELYDQFGGFDLTYKIAADYDCMLRFLSKRNLIVLYIPEVFVNMRVGVVSNKSLSNILQKSREDYRALKSNHVGGVLALVWKNLSKLPQFFIRQ